MAYDLEFEKHLAALEKQLLSLQQKRADKLKPEERAAQPRAGDLFSFEAPAPGLSSEEVSIIPR